MRSRYLTNGIRGMQPHEMLEILMYHAIPRADTNPLGHALLDRFGSVSGVLSASPQELAQVPGMTENAVTMLMYLRDLYCYAEADRLRGCPLDSFAGCCELFARLYQFESRRLVRAVFLDDRLRLISSEILLSGGIGELAELPVTAIASRAAAAGSQTVIISHNHRTMPAKPSKEDIAVTRHLVPKLRQQGIQLIDHIIIGVHDALSLREAGVFMGLEE